MRRLVGVELARFRSSRVVLAVLVVAVVAAGLFAFRTAYDSRPFSRAEVATARAQASMAAEAKRGDVKECLADPATMLGPGATASDCRADLVPQTTDFLTRAPLRLRVVMQNNGLHLAVLVLVLLVVAGAAFAGSDWASRSLRNQLLAESRRTRVWLAKAAAVSLGSLVIAALALAVFWVPLRIIAAERGLSVTAGSLVVWHIVRTLVLAAVAPVGAYALAMLFRSTVGAVGLVFGVSLAAEVLLGPLPVRGTGWLTPSHNVFAWLLGSTHYFDASLRCGGPDCKIRVLDMWPAGAVLAVVTAVVMALSWADFRRRDVP
ncbi:hypothetical protein D9V37_11125 [Nocardioides mangrovicus]|uniref:ABC transporter permease n=1 Tax=Nocardioides mangrovicus TaxID=2478913 RepID=A0A3L8P2N6_9ACTN|nr:hypothetical protein [Nocardioides mangrovicus]RLV49113.1 hypothetical protein D9V37_11125 [Nocardioides mangrovicus]